MGNYKYRYIQNQANMEMNVSGVPDGEYTKTIYTLMREQKYNDIIQILSAELAYSPRNRAGLSLLGYCYYQIQDYGNAADCYDQLTKFYPDVDSYKLYHA